MTRARYFYEGPSVFLLLKQVDFDENDKYRELVYDAFEHLEVAMSTALHKARLDNPGRQIRWEKSRCTWYRPEYIGYLDDEGEDDPRWVIREIALFTEQHPDGNWAARAYLDLLNDRLNIWGDFKMKDHYHLVKSDHSRGDF